MNTAQSELKTRSFDISIMDDNNLRIPLAKIRPMIKLDPDVQLVSMDSVYLITKATEMFIEYLTQESFRVTMSKKRKTVSKQDVDEAVAHVDALHFLDDGVLDLDPQLINKGNYESPPPQ